LIVWHKFVDVENWGRPCQAAVPFFFGSGFLFSAEGVSALRRGTLSFLGGIYSIKDGGYDVAWVSANEVI